MCGARPDCNKKPQVAGLTLLAATTCGDPQCVGVEKDAQYPNADAEFIKQTNGTPDAFPTKKTFNVGNFTPQKKTS